MKIAFLYEHPTWSEKLIQCFNQNNIELKLINIDELVFDTSNLDLEYDVLINRVNIMPYEKRDSAVVFHTLHFLNWLNLSNVRVINGAQSHYIGASKALQNGVFASLGLRHPKAVALYKTLDALKAAQTIGYPLIVKPNIGGSGSGISRYDNAEELQKDIEDKILKLGVDRSGLAQEYIHSDGYVYRVEVLGDDLFYSIRQKIVENQFNYCAADGCSVETQEEIIVHPEQEREFDFCIADSGAKIELYDVPKDILGNVVNIIKKSGADFGGVEFFIDKETGDAIYYDFNPYSNFVSHGEELLGFSPEQRFVDFILSWSNK